ncbi:hypothetical protein DFP72DRAFT_1080830 [Ephemerocybe angulata]|uniref:Uncharacterized protein n=1 Tax=Ephemerocybe angulata TaxID=980116 RepID=A0A8H6H9X0_9AGAR|nr:hypothetical protein DFP72DRAFT_1080830 [Tulosesus angulatus]
MPLVFKNVMAPSSDASLALFLTCNRSNEIDSSTCAIYRFELRALTTPQSNKLVKLDAKLVDILMHKLCEWHHAFCDKCRNDMHPCPGCEGPDRCAFYTTGETHCFWKKARYAEETPTSDTEHLEEEGAVTSVNPPLGHIEPQYPALYDTPQGTPYTVGSSGVDEEVTDSFTSTKDPQTTATSPGGLISGSASCFDYMFDSAVTSTDESLFSYSQLISEGSWDFFNNMNAPSDVKTTPTSWAQGDVAVIPTFDPHTFEPVVDGLSWSMASEGCLNPASQYIAAGSSAALDGTIVPSDGPLDHVFWLTNSLHGFSLGDFEITGEVKSFL